MRTLGFTQLKDFQIAYDGLVANGIIFSTRETKTPRGRTLFILKF